MNRPFPDKKPSSDTTGQRLTRRTGLAVLTGALVATAAWPTLRANAAEGLEVVEPWARASGENRTTTAYLTIINHNDADDRLIAATSPLAVKCVLEKNGWKGLTPTQRPLDDIAVKAMSRTELKPGGLQIRLNGMTQGVRQKDTVPLTLTFASGARVEITATVFNRLLGESRSS